MRLKKELIVDAKNELFRILKNIPGASDDELRVQAGKMASGLRADATREELILWIIRWNIHDAFRLLVD